MAPKPARKFLGQCLDGIVASSYQSYELIVVEMARRMIAPRSADKYPDIATVFGSYDDSPCGGQLLVTI